MVGANGVGPENSWGACGPGFPNQFFVAGTERHFQAVYRDDPWGASCSTGLNTSQGVSILFLP